MFSLPKLPTQLPRFGILGDDAKLAFRTSAGGLRRLTEETIPLSDENYWLQYTTLFDTAGEAFTLINPSDIYRSLLHRPENVATLLTYLITKLSSLLGDHTFPASAPSISSSLNPLNSLPINLGGNTDRNPTKQVLNCIRVISRILPVIFGLEVPGWEESLMWKQRTVVIPPPSAGGGYGQRLDEAPQFVIDDEEEEEESGSTQIASQPASTAEPTTQIQPSLAEQLINTLIDLLFCCGFTLPEKTRMDHHKFQYVIWEKGVGSSLTPSATSREQSYLDSNRTEVLRLLLILLSKQIYLSPSAIAHTPALYTKYLVQKVPRKTVLTLLCSLLNTVVNSSTTRPQGTATSAFSAGIAGVGKGLTKGLNQLPYTQALIGEDTKEALVSIASQVLIVTLDYQSNGTLTNSVGASTGEARSPPEDPASTQPSAKRNHFRYFLSKIHKPADFNYLLEGIVAILSEEIGRAASIIGMGLGALQTVGVANSPAPSARLAEEVVILLWQLLEINNKFQKYVINGDRAVDVMAALLCLLMEFKDNSKSHGICRALSYMVQSLTADPSFGPQLSSVTIKIPVPAKWNIIGTATDFFVSSIYSIISPAGVPKGQPPGQFSSAYPALVISIANCAPCFKNLSTNASNKLVQLITAFSDPRMLLAEEGNPRLVYFMLDALNSVLYRNPSHNPHLLYSIVRAHMVFQDLGTFTLKRGLRDAKMRQEDEENTTHSRTSSVSRGKRIEGGSESTGAHEEKARLLAAEGRRQSDVEDTTNSLEQLRISSPPPTGPSTWAEQRSPVTPNSPGLSEKARGKMRERQESLDMDESTVHAAAVAIGKNGFVPTQEWVTSWVRGLPLDPIMLTVSELLPKIQEIQTSMNRPSTSPAVLDFLRVVNLSPILPERPPTSSRPFLWTDSSLVWTTSLIWGDIFVKNMSPLGVWNGTNVRLFYIKQAQPVNRQLTDAVSNVMTGLLGRSESPARTT
ncbi:hypothetical protein PIIN_03518 [Serendipita indica DSM 11827]|uniref:Protein HID1 n=1 Tax=Serendipita indica (strain DSM 11827) TaxID=1109443 RepID=G4TE50_SERID|nr:hypothetical protein PIIN_03518 [Serendipita indica DSM 11827]